jgi:hypothetical protein
MPARAHPQNLIQTNGVPQLTLPRAKNTYHTVSFYTSPASWGRSAHTIPFCASGKAEAINDGLLGIRGRSGSQAYQLRLAHYGVEGLASDIPSLDFPISRIASRADRERVGIIIRPLRDLRNDMVHSSNTDERAALEEFRRHVARCILDTC